MKKILTLLVMFLATVNILLAQTPKLTYQIVVRDQANNLVVNQELTAMVTIGGHQIQRTATTNMNGMLVLTLEEEATTTPWMQDIDWSNATINVRIENQALNVNVDKTLPVYAVPYALLAADNDDALTTAEIVRYLKNVPVDEFDQVIDAFWTNDAQPQNISTYLQDTVIKYIKANVGAVRNLTLYYVGKLDADNTQEAYDAVSDEVKDAIAQKVGEVAKNHKDAAVEIAVYYLSNATENDINGVINTLSQNEAAKEIMAAAVDSVVDYIINHQDLVISIGKAMVDAVEITQEQMETILDYVRANEPVYEAIKDILNSCIYAYLDTNFRAVSDSSCHPVDICALRDQILWARSQRHTSCPEISEVQLNGINSEIVLTSLTTSFTMSSSFINNKGNVDLTGAEYKFIATFPNSKYEPVTFNGTYDDATHTFSYEVTGSEMNLFWGRKAEITAMVTGLRCKALTVENNTPALVKSQTYECPQFASFSHTDPGKAATLGKNEGVILKAELKSNYGTITERGFVIARVDGQTDTLKSTVTSSLAFSNKLDMIYCGQTLTVYAYVKCGDEMHYSETSTFELRGVTVTLASSANSWKTGDDPIVLTAGNVFPISTQMFCDALGTCNPSVEQIVEYATAHQDLYGDYLDYMTGYGYTWTFPTVGTQTPTADEKVVNVTLDDATPGDDVPYTVTFSVILFGSECSVSKTVEIHRDND